MIAIDAAAVTGILQPLTLRLSERRISVIGANGSGKSTFLKLLNGLVLPDEGAVTVEGLDTRRDGSRIRKMVGFVFTDPLAQLVMPTVLEDMELSFRQSHRRPAERHAAALEALEKFGLSRFAERSIYDLSGGERQLLALAVVLATKPRVLVADEPTTLLDLRNQLHIRRVFAEVEPQVIFATHDLDFAKEAARTLVFDSGRMVFDGPPDDAIPHYRRLCGA